MRSSVLVAGLIAFAIPFASPAAAQRGGMNPDPTTKIAGSGQLPDGWEVYLDPNRFDKMTVKDLSFTESGGTFHIATGPAGVYWTRKDVVPNGSYTYTASFTQLKAPRHNEAYGLMIAGRDMGSADTQSYVYFEVRGSNDFLINHRAGADVHKLVNWTANPAIKAKDESGRATNELTIAVGADSVRFIANGAQVTALARSAMGDLSGVYGFRVNHNSDVQITGVKFTRQ
ncbi:MAG TPA: hypothetical protein VF737_15895 [Gemmatimonadaceae bacterium]